MAHEEKEQGFKNLENRLDGLTRIDFEKKIISLYSKSFPGMKTDDVTILGYGPYNGDEDDEAAYIVKYQAILPNGHTRNDTIAASELFDGLAIYKRVIRERYNLDSKLVLQELRRRYEKHGNKVRILGLKIAIYGKTEDDGIIIFETMSKCGNRKGRISLDSLFKRK